MRNCRPQSTPARRPQPATRAPICLAVAGLVACFAAPLAAQQATVQRDGALFAAEPGGLTLGRVAAGAVVTTQGRRGADQQVLLDGWMFRASLKRDARDGHNLSVTTPEENLRAQPNGRVLARLVQGALLDEVERRGGWIHVRRSGWIASAAFGQAAPRAARPPRAVQTAPLVPPVESAGTQELDPRRAVLRRRVQLFLAPDTPSTGFLDAGVPVRITARSGEWVRIETSGWVKESEVRPAGGQAVSGVTAADLRAHPEEWQGKVIEWGIQFIALQTADELRAPDFTPGQRYILARGPAPEYAFVYVTVPPEKLDRIAQLRPLDTLTVLARVRSGRSAFLANPILDLMDVVQ